MSQILNIETSTTNCSVSLSFENDLVDCIEQDSLNYSHSGGFSSKGPPSDPSTLDGQALGCFLDSLTNPINNFDKSCSK